VAVIMPSLDPTRDQTGSALQKFVKTDNQSLKT